MAKREEAGSGLRAGFISEEEALRQMKRQAEDESLAEPLEPAVPKTKKSAKDESKAEVAAEPKPEEPAEEGPTLEMQGISGKIITSVIKVVKKKKPQDTPDEPASEVLAEKKADDSKPAAAEVKVDRETAAPPVAAALPETPAAVEVPVEKPAAPAETKTPDAPAPEIAKTPKAPDSKPEPAAAPAKAAAKAPQADDPAKKPVEKPQTAKPRAEKTAAAAPAAPKDVTAKEPAAKAESPAHVKPAAPKSQLKQPKPPQPTPLASRPAPFRPQRGSYVGREADAAPPRRAPQGSSPGQRRDFGGRPSAPGGRPAPGQRYGQGPRPVQGTGDKDRDDAPRQTRSPYQSQAKPAAPVGDIGKRQSRGQRDSKRQRDRHAQRDDRSKEGNLNVRQRSRRKSKDSDVPRQVSQLKQVALPSSLTVKELAEMLKKTTAEVIMKLMGYGVLATLNQEIDYDTAEIVATEFGIKASQLVEISEEDILFDDSEDEDTNLVPRPPVVVVMGHVDHGKTSILDYIRKANVATGEAGGITQHIGAYTANVHDQKITFLDTPGHEAFTTMRARGAQVTDIAILVVAADDGVMPQTVEAINHARAAETEIIVAINKIDRPQANIDRVRQELAKHDLMSSDWGGTTTIVEVSAKTGQNMDELLDMVLLTADVLELKANPDRQAKGTVIEAKLDTNRGPVATLLVQRGTLRVGDTIVVSATIGNVRAMVNDRGEAITEAGPSVPVEVLGLPEVPEGGDVFYEVENERVGRALVDKRRVQQRESHLRHSSRMSLDNLFTRLSEGQVQTLNIIVKGDVQGSVEAVRQSLEKLSGDEVKVQVIHGAVGAVTESDVRLAEVSDAIVIGFNVRPTNTATELADSVGVDVRLYRVIYNAIEDIEAAMRGMLSPDMKEFVLGHAEVRDIFRITGVGTIAGCYVQDGKIGRHNEIRVVRDGIVAYEGKIDSLRRFKDDVREVAAGYECGIGIERFNDIKNGDILEAFEMRAVERTS